ncbi:hypothetical protein [Haloferula sargassicola]|uniref:DUF1449 family protein n=1 Tax=Haloferula sargassicola TaxID=490096 RepID=A0ABP9UGN1_9BACT
MIEEIWNLAISPGVLPLSILLIPMALFWVTCLIGSFDFDFIGFDGGEGGFDSGDGGDLVGGSMRWLFRFFHGDEVPVAALLSFLLVYLWGGAMLGHYFFPPGNDGVEAAKLDAWALLPALVLTKLTALALRPMFISLRGLEGEAKPVLGRAGRVRSRVCDASAGQVEVEDPESPLLINARLAPGAEPLSRGTRVMVESRDPDRDVYLVKVHPENS